MPSILISEEGFIALTLYCIQSRASRIFNRHFYRCHVKVWRSSRSFHRQPHILHGVATQSFQSPSPIMRQGSPRRVLSTGNMASIEYRRTGFRGKQHVTSLPTILPISLNQIIVTIFLASVIYHPRFRLCSRVLIC